MSRVEETKQNFIDASSFREPNKIPVGVDINGWALAYAGVTLDEVVHEPAKFAEAYCKIFDQLPVDYVITTSFPGIPWKVVEALGSNAWGLNDDKSAITHRQAYTSYMGPEIYDELINDPSAVMDEKLWKHRYPAFSLPENEAYGSVINALEEIKIYCQTNQLIEEYFNEKEVFSMLGTPYGMVSPFNHIFDRVRGIKNSLMDIRRMPEKVSAACDAMWQTQKNLLQCGPEEAKEPLPLVNCGYHAECFLSLKHFNEYIWKYFAENVGPLMEAGKKIFIYGEGDCMHLYDNFRQFPKGSVIIKPDTEDLFEMHKRIGDWVTINAGAPTDLMASGSKQQCIDYVKRCFDTFAPGGGFIFGTNREIVAANDAKAENLIAVYETADLLSRGRG